MDIVETLATRPPRAPCPNCGRLRLREDFDNPSTAPPPVTVVDLTPAPWQDSQDNLLFADDTPQPTPGTAAQPTDANGLPVPDGFLAAVGGSNAGQPMSFSVPPPSSAAPVLVTLAPAPYARTMVSGMTDTHLLALTTIGFTIVLLLSFIVGMSRR